MKRGFANTDYGQVYFYIKGDGPPLLLLHPTPQSGRIYKRLASKLAKNYCVVVPDTLGFGLSDPLPKDMTMTDLANSVAQVMDAAETERAHVFGFHTGNKIATALAAEHPKRIGKLILCGQTHSLVTKQLDRNAAFGSITDRYFASAEAERNADNPALAHMQWATETFSDFSRLWWDKRAISEFGYSIELKQYLSARIMDLLQSKESTNAIYTANFIFDFEAALRRIVAPTLIIEVTSAAEAHLGPQAEILAHLIKDGSHATIADGDREILEMRTAEVWQLLEEFLTRT